MALLLPFEELLSAVRDFNSPDDSRSVPDRCLRRLGAGNLHTQKPSEPKPAHGTFMAHDPGYVYIDVKGLHQTADEQSGRELHIPALENVAEVRLSTRFGPQPSSDGAKSPEPQHL